MGELRRTFSGLAVNLAYSGELEEPLRRVPGALAALHQDRSKPRLPHRLEVRASDGFDELRLLFEPYAAAQLITADPIVRGYSFIHEMPGAFECSGHIAGTSVAGRGLGILELVD
jgi:hypothetical protein